MNEFSIGQWVAQSMDFNGIRRFINFHVDWRATFFKDVESRDVFLDASKQTYPDQEFFAGTLEGQPIIQTRPKR